RRACLLEPEVVELAHRRVAVGAQLAVDVHVSAPDGLRRLRSRKTEHRLAPRPEVAALDPPAQRPLERMAVGIDEAGNPGKLWHARILSTWRLRLPQCRRRSRTSRTRSRSCGLRGSPSAECSWCAPAAGRAGRQASRSGSPGSPTRSTDSSRAA